MAVTDVDLVTQPTAHLLEFAIQPSVASSRLIFQHFNTNDPLVAIVAPHNSDAKQSDSNEWPPPIIFDVAYGCAVLKTWGVIDFLQFAWKRTRGTYYDFDDDNENNDGGGGGDAGDAGGGGDSNGGDGSDKQANVRRSKRIHNQARNREAAKGKKALNVGRLARNTEDGRAGDIADMVMALWVQNAKKCPRQAHAMQVDSNWDKVRTWLESAE
jgi:hypothetical protein